MSKTQIVSGGITDGTIATADIAGDAVTEAKIADDAVESEHLNNNIISGQTELASEPADTDEFLVSDAGTLKRIDYSLIKASGGLSNADQFRLTSSFTGDASPINANLSRVSEVGSAGGEVGSQMAVSSGIFTFPQTGMYLVSFTIRQNNAIDSGALEGQIEVTTNNSSYSTIAECRTSGGTNTQDSAHCEVLLDVTDTSNVKVRFDASQQDDRNSTLGDTNKNLTHMTFLRLGDT
jgi:hypothetical protein